MTRGKHIAVLGSGIMGSSLALQLARRGHRVSLFEQSARPFDAASRWNEGKIHLGYLYAGDPTLATARHMLPGSLAFRREVEALTGTSIEPAITQTDDIYLCHRESVVSPDHHWRRLQELDRELAGRVTPADYLIDLTGRRCSRLSSSELADISGSGQIVAGFRLPERSVDTHWIADHYVNALEAEPRIDIHTGFHVERVAPDSEAQESWTVESGGDTVDGFEVVINALWEGRLRIDAQNGLRLPQQWSHRYRRSLFVRSSRIIDIPSAVVTLGPFGDIKNYNGRDFYLSWYPAGLAATGTEPEPPAIAPLDAAGERALTDQVFEALSQLIPSVSQLKRNIESMRIGGGWVYVAARGDLADPDSDLHRRYDYGLQRYDNYFSVDSGKYCTAPWMARKIAEQLDG